MLQSDRIRFILNDFRPQQQRSSRGSMHMTWLPLAFKPTLWRQKYERQYEHAEDVPLPGISGVSPEEDLFDKAKQSASSLPVRSKFWQFARPSEGAT